MRIVWTIFVEMWKTTNEKVVDIVLQCAKNYYF